MKCIEERRPRRGKQTRKTVRKKKVQAESRVLNARGLKCWNKTKSAEISIKRISVSRSLLGGNVALGGLVSHCVCAVMWGGSVHQCQKLFFKHTQNTHPHVQSCCIGSRTTVVFCFFFSFRDLKSARTLKRKTWKLQTVVSKQWAAAAHQK